MMCAGKLFGVLAVLFLTNLDVMNFVFGLGWKIVIPAALWLLLCFAAFNIVPNWRKHNFSRLGIMLGGEILIEVSIISFTLNVILEIIYLTLLFPAGKPVPSPGGILFHVLFCLFVTWLMAMNGFIRIYASSVQMGIKWRVIFLIFWWVPIFNLIFLKKICGIVREEYTFETEKQKLNNIRKCSEICRTRYPVVLVHGVFFGDRKVFNYWGRIPGELMRNGAEIFYGSQQSAAATEDAALELKENIMEIIAETGCEKVNIIAHSKGGLESRCAISQQGLAPFVASLTTVNTPHQGCAFVDWLLERVPQCISRWISARYNGALRKLGDTNPDFYAAVSDLTSRRCRDFNLVTPDAPGVFYQSVGSKMKGWRSAPFPLNLAYILVRFFEKENDGLVSVESMKWGSRFIMAFTPGHRGISHGDMIDLNRQNIRGFDVREFYVDIVRELKEKGF